MQGKAREMQSLRHSLTERIMKIDRACEFMRKEKRRCRQLCGLPKPTNRHTFSAHIHM
ncbi:Uncharacterised protein [Vibrio cholerae]|nr:Uncharacterised protein [Vibrio cholerae]